MAGGWIEEGFSEPNLEIRVMSVVINLLCLSFMSSVHNGIFHGHLIMSATKLTNKKTKTIFSLINQSINQSINHYFPPED